MLPELECQPTTRVVQADGRIDVAVHRRALAEVLGWSPGPLAHELDGRWVVLGEPEAGTRTRRGDRARLSGTSRIVLPAALRRLLGVSVGDKVLLLPLPSTRRLALTHPGVPVVVVLAPMAISHARATAATAGTGLPAAITARGMPKATVLASKGNGPCRTAKFAIPAPAPYWQVNWWYNCRTFNSGTPRPGRLRLRRQHPYRA